MSAGPIAVKQKTDNSLKLHFKKSDGTDQDITGWTVRFTVKRSVNSPEPVFDVKTITEHADPIHGISYVPLTDGDLDLPARAYIYGIHPVDADGNDRDSGVGSFIVEAVAEAA